MDLGGPSGPDQAVTLCSVKRYGGGAWNSEGVILFAAQGTLYRVLEKGGPPVVVSSPDAGICLYPSFLPDNRHFLFETMTPLSDHVTIRAGSLDSPVSKVLFEADSNAIFAQGRLLYVRDTTLFAQPFNPQKLMTSGAAVPLAEHLSVFSGCGNFSASAGGPLVYAFAGSVAPFELVWFDRKHDRLSTLGGVRIPMVSQDYALSLSPDQKAVAVEHREAGNDNTDIWLYDTANGTRTRLTFDGAKKLAPVWSSDSQTVVFSSSRRGHFDLYRRAAYGSGPEELLYADESDKYPTSWSSDGKYLLYDRVDRHGARRSTWVLPLTSGRSSTEIKPFPLTTTQAGERGGQFSPDGRWVAYESPESGRSEIYIAPFRENADSLAGRRQVSNRGGTSVRWRRDEKEIFYLSGRSLLAAGINIQDSTMHIGEEHQIIGALSILNYDVSSDGQRFLVRTRARQLISQPLIVVQNWAASLNK
jgi:Tol biopolymer transport system component